LNPYFSSGMQYMGILTVDICSIFATNKKVDNFVNLL